MFNFPCFDQYSPFLTYLLLIDVDIKVIVYIGRFITIYDKGDNFDDFLFAFL